MPLNVLQLEHIEQIAMFFERRGVPRMAGRVMAWMVLSGEAHQTAKQMATALEVSAGSISAATRVLVAMGMLERRTVRGQRGVRYSIQQGAWTRLVDHHVAVFAQLRELLERSRDLTVVDPSALVWEPLKEAIGLYRALEEGVPRLVDDYFTHIPLEPEQT